MKTVAAFITAILLWLSMWKAYRSFHNRHGYVDSISLVTK